MRNNALLSSDLIQFVKNGAGKAKERKKTINNYIKEGANINARDPEGKTVLHYAVLKNELSLVKYLVENHKANINIKDNNIKTPSEYANAYSSYAQKIKIFFESRKVISKHHINNESSTLSSEIVKFHNIILYGTSNDLKTYLIKNKKVIRKIINEPGTKSQTAFEIAVKNIEKSYFDIKIIALLNAGADYSLLNYQEGSFINFAIKNGILGNLTQYCLKNKLFKINITHPEAVLPPLCYLFTIASTKNFLIGSRYKFYDSKNNCKEIDSLIYAINLFTDNGIDINDKDENGDTALNYILKFVFNSKDKQLDFLYCSSTYKLIELYPNIKLNPLSITSNKINRFFKDSSHQTYCNSLSYGKYFIKLLEFLIKNGVELEGNLFANLSSHIPSLTTEIDNIKELSKTMENTCNVAFRLNKLRSISRDPIAAFSQSTNIPNDIVEKEILPFVANHKDGSIIYNILKNDRPSSRGSFVEKYLESKNSPSQTVRTDIQDNATPNSKKAKIR